VTSRRRTCTVADARARVASGKAFLDIAERLVTEGFDADVAVTNAVHAGIAASDALCCLRLGERSADQDHASATVLLARVDKSLAIELTRLLALKTKAAYETRRVSDADAKGALRRAAKLIAAAAAALESV
jgi:triphosphoribosyl-dephospho-CoA synthetase